MLRSGRDRVSGITDSGWSLGVEHGQTSPDRRSDCDPGSVALQKNKVIPRPNGPDIDWSVDEAMS